MNGIRISRLLQMLALVNASLLAAGCAGGESNVADSSRGRQLYMANCALCHGAAGEGKAALGKSLIDNEFMRGLTDDELVQFLVEGRRADHPLNTKGVDMPPRGGNPGLSDDDLRQIVVFIRGLS